MPTYSKSDRLESLRFARRVAQLADEAPNEFCRKAVDSAFIKIRRGFSFSLRRRKEIVLILVENGYATYDEIVQASHISKTKVIEAVDALSKEDRVRLLSIGGGQQGRPQVRIFLPSAPVQPPTEKLCTKCGEVQPLSEFRSDRRGALGVEARCKPCRRSQFNGWYRKSN